MDSRSIQGFSLKRELLFFLYIRNIFETSLCHACARYYQLVLAFEKKAHNLTWVIATTLK